MYCDSERQYVIFPIRSGKQGTLKKTFTLAIVFHLNKLSARCPIVVGILVHWENPFFQHSFFIIFIILYLYKLICNLLNPPSKFFIPSSYQTRMVVTT